MKKTFLAIAIAIFLFGCATAPKQAWHNPNKTGQEFYRDMAKCEALANSAGSQQIVPATRGAA